MSIYIRMPAIIRRYRSIPTDARMELEDKRSHAKSERGYIKDRWTIWNAEYRKKYRRRKNKIGWPFCRSDMVAAVTAIDALAVFVAGSNIAPMKKRARP